MTVKLYHCSRARSLRPLWTLEEMGLDYQLEVLKFPPRLNHEDYLKINPLGTVPTLVDGDTVLTESTAICHYLVDKYGPTDLGVTSNEAAYGEYLNWLYRSDATYTMPQSIVIRYGIVAPEDRKLPLAVQDFTDKFNESLVTIEDALADRDYLCAGRFTIADIAVGYALHLAGNIKLSEGFGARTKTYIARLKSRPAFKRALEL